MMTAGSISSDSSAAYAEYLDAKARAPERGDYYLGRDGLPAEAPGRPTPNTSPANREPPSTARSR
jgi:hypothetical protein